MQMSEKIIKESPNCTDEISEEIIRELPTFPNDSLFRYNITKKFDKYPKIKNYIRSVDHYINLKEKLLEYEYSNDFKLWINGINYSTGKKIDIDGRTHYIKKKDEWVSYKTYLAIKECEEIGIDNLINEEGKYNAKIREYREFNDVIHRIKTLKNYNDYVEYKGEKYGLPEEYKKVKIVDEHEINCNGNFKCYATEYDIKEYYRNGNLKNRIEKIIKNTINAKYVFIKKSKI